MRRRATFVPEKGIEFNPADIQLNGRQLLHPGLRAAREERLTFPLGDIPEIMRQAIGNFSELHIRWNTEKPYKAPAPFLSRSIPGLHVLFGPPSEPGRHLCGFLKAAFSEKFDCVSPDLSFIQTPFIEHPSAPPPAAQYYSVLPQLTKFVAYIQREICSPTNILCFHQASLLNAADYVDIDYSVINQAVTLTAFWSKPLENYFDPIGELIFEHQWPLDISAGKNDRVEVGILSSSDAVEPHELQLGGFLTVVGEDDKPRPTLFSFPSRHRTLPLPQSEDQKYTVSFNQPTGLHPTLKITFPLASALKAPDTGLQDSHCRLQAYFHLPRTIFADRYAFPLTDSDPLFEEAHHITFMRSMAGNVDLEAPDYVIYQWGSMLLLEPSVPSNTTSAKALSSPWEITVPLHLRYREPSNDQPHKSHQAVDIPWPDLYWVCRAEQGTKFNINPFDRTNLGYDTLYGSRTIFYHVPRYVSPSSAYSVSPATRLNGDEARLIETIQVPILNTSKVGGSRVVQLGTLVVILFGFAWVWMKLWPSYGGIRLGSDEDDSEKKKKTHKKKQ